MLEGIKSKYNKTWEEFLKENGEELIQLVAETFREDEESDQEMEDPWEDSEIPDFRPEDSKVVESILEQDWKKAIYRKEAIIYAIYGKKAWIKTPGAVAWLHKNIKR